MVNSPSRLNLRPPAPVECGGLTPHWPNQSPRPGCWAFEVGCFGNQTKSNHPGPSFASLAVSPDLRNPKSVPGSAPIKAKTPAIKANRASSSLIKANGKLPERARPRAQQRPNLPAASPCPNPPRSQSPKSENRFLLQSSLNQGKNPNNQG